MRSYTLLDFESGDVEISQAGDGKLAVTIQCAPIHTYDKDRVEIELRFEPMERDRIIGLLTPFRFEIRDFEDDAS